MTKPFNRVGRIPSDHQLEELPASDPAHVIVRTIVAVAPVSSWCLARLRAGAPKQLLASTPGEWEYDPLRWLETELALLRRRVPRGPQIAASVAPPSRYPAALSLVFADRHEDFAVLALFREKELGPFASSEIRALTIALHVASEWFAAARLLNSPGGRLVDVFTAGSEPPSDEIMARSAERTMYVLDADLRIVHGSVPGIMGEPSLSSAESRLTNRLPRVLEDAVRTLTASWTADPATQVPGIARPLPFLVVAVQPLSNRTGMRVGVLIERCRTRNSLTAIATRFSISPRELQVLALLLDGKTLKEISTALHITSSTVQDHVKSLLDKTAAHSRSEMIAKTLGWHVVQ